MRNYIQTFTIYYQLLTGNKHVRVNRGSRSRAMLLLPSYLFYYKRSCPADCEVISSRLSIYPCLVLTFIDSSMFTSSGGILVLHPSIFSEIFRPIFFQQRHIHYHFWPPPITLLTTRPTQNFHYGRTILRVLGGSQVENGERSIRYCGQLRICSPRPMR